MTPRYIKRYDVNCNVGFFLLKPFPCEEVFATFPFAREILKSLLCSDVVGFNTFRDAL